MCFCSTKPLPRIWIELCNCCCCWPQWKPVTHRHKRNTNIDQCWFFLPPFHSFCRIWGHTKYVWICLLYGTSMTWTNPKNSRRNIPRGRMADDWRTCTNTLEEGPKSFRSDMNVGDIELNAWSHLCVALFSSQRFFSTVYFPHMCTPTQRRENIYIYIYSWIFVVTRGRGTNSEFKPATIYIYIDFDRGSMMR